MAMSFSRSLSRTGASAAIFAVGTSIKRIPKLDRAELSLNVSAPSGVSRTDARNREIGALTSGTRTGPCARSTTMLTTLRQLRIGGRVAPRRAQPGSAFATADNRSSQRLRPPRLVRWPMLISGGQVDPTRGQNFEGAHRLAEHGASIFGLF